MDSEFQDLYFSCGQGPFHTVICGDDNLRRQI